jgi:EAL domain-containing protein (putative c-di-GMP-specific phosphodiesterase class I)
MSSLPPTFAKHEFEQAFETGAITHHLQGIVNLSTHKVQYFEALARWKHPKLGLINAACFVEDLATHGFVAQLTQVAIQSTKDYLNWVLSQHRVPLPVSINITASEFEAHDYANYLCNLLDKAAIPFSLVNIEMLEWGHANDLALVGHVVETLKQRGIKVYADDFGHAYGSFHRLMNIHYSGLKLDCEYARAIETRLEAQVIIEAMAKFSERLSLSFVVEGIETKGQAEYLQSLGVKSGQGYLYNRPMPLLEAHLLLDHDDTKK